MGANIIPYAVFLFVIHSLWPISGQIWYRKLTLINCQHWWLIDWSRIQNSNLLLRVCATVLLEVVSPFWWQQSLLGGREQLLFKIMNAPWAQVAMFCVGLWLHAWISDGKITFCEFDSQIWLFLHQILNINNQSFKCPIYWSYCTCSRVNNRSFHVP